MKRIVLILGLSLLLVLAFSALALADGGSVAYAPGVSAGDIPQAAIDDLRQSYPDGEIIIYGISYGAGAGAISAKGADSMDLNTITVIFTILNFLLLAGLLVAAVLVLKLARQAVKKLRD